MTVAMMGIRSREIRGVVVDIPQPASTSYMEACMQIQKESVGGEECKEVSVQNLELSADDPNWPRGCLGSALATL
jgi:hypothetical protein